MIRVLLDSSNRYLTVGLARGEELLDGVHYEAWQRQSELLVAELDRLLHRHALRGQDIGEVAVAIGPGSFTGVRIALTVAKTIAYANKARLYIGSSLALYKTKGVPTICLMNARSGRSYIGVYHDDQVLFPDTVMNDEDVLSYCHEHPDWLIAGDVAHLGLQSAPVDVMGQLLSFFRPAYEAKNIFAVRPVYLKKIPHLEESSHADE